MKHKMLKAQRRQEKQALATEKIDKATNKEVDEIEIKANEALSIHTST